MTSTPRINTVAEMIVQRHTEYLAIEEAAHQRKQLATGTRMDEKEIAMIRTYWLEMEQRNIGEWMQLGLGLPGVIEALHDYSESVYRELQKQ